MPMEGPNAQLPWRLMGFRIQALDIVAMILASTESTDQVRPERTLVGRCRKAAPFVLEALLKLIRTCRCAALIVLFLPGCDLTEQDEIHGAGIAGTYERWSWRHGVDGPTNRYLIYKSVFDEEGYYYEYGVVTISYRRYQYDDENKRIRFSGEFTDGPNFDSAIWQDLKWYSKTRFCIKCFKKVSDYTGPNQG